MSDFRKIVTSAVGVPITASDDEIATALADMIRGNAHTSTPTTPATSSPASPKNFVDMVTSIMQSESCSYGDAASKVSILRPDLYEAHRDQANLN